MLLNFKQARWNEPLIFEKSEKGKIGHLLPKPSEEERKAIEDPEKLIPENLLRKIPPSLPEVSEVEVVRHFTRLSQENYGVDLGIYPLGSCTMKYNPKICEQVVRSHKLTMLHPYQDESLCQGILEILYELSNFIAEITGMHKVSLQPSAGAHGELAGALIIRAYHKNNGKLNEKTEMIIPDSAHGTNPASAAMAGFKVIVVQSNEDGCIDLEALKAAVNKKTAGLMITNPNTLGIFEKNILEISKIIHEVDGLLYYDGANLNAILGKVRPGDMGFDIVHVNIHKTFSTPHGGGGPGAGPIGVTKGLEKFLPVPTVEFDGGKYYLDYNKPLSIGKIKSFYGNVSVLVKAYAYILSLGAEGLENVAELSVLNSNYVLKKIMEAKGYALPYNPKVHRKHEGVISAEALYKETGVRTLNIAKRLLDLGVHAPTVYFPLIVNEALMIEPTETESLSELNKLIEAFKKASEEAFSNPKLVLDAPKNTTVSKIDEVKASHPKTLCLNWKMYKKQQT
ncbi:MAG: aminomethyl-transferring glycine dehydrogenase subunit GcvPB [Candidatus Bathyarchaeia archaeon]